MAPRKLAGLLLAFGLAVALVPGCAKQGEGERCDNQAAGNADCDSGLVCVLASDLADYIVGTTLFVDGGMCLYPGFEDNG